MREFIRDGINFLGYEISEEQLDSLLRYSELLLSWNEKINLTAIREPREVAVKHFADSLTGLSLLPENARVIDVGAGAGFPSLPLKIMRDDISVTMLDSLNKRVSFLNEVISVLGLKKTAAIHARAEELAKKNGRESYDVCVSRAVARLCVLSEYCLPYVKIGGSFLAYKGPEVGGELEEAKAAIAALGGEVADIKRYNLPASDITHSIIVIKKIRQTPTKYPRNSGKISKSPIS